MGYRSRPSKRSYDDVIDGITYDRRGRMQYHPDFHFNHGIPFTIDEMIYTAKYYEIDGARTISFAIGKTEGTVQSKVDEMKQNGMYEIYKNLSDDNWLKLITPKSRYSDRSS